MECATVKAGVIARLAWVYVLIGSLSHKLFSLIGDLKL